MTKSSYTQPSYYYGLPDVYMQMGYYPFPTQPATEPIGRSVPIPYAMAMASECKYYLGQTEKITAGEGGHGFGALVNPLRSGVQLYVNDWFLTNFACQPVEARIWFGKTSSITGAKTSHRVSPGFAQLSPCPPAQGKILFSSEGTEEPRDGVFVSTRIVPPMTTISAEKSGHWILGPGMSLMFQVPGTEENEPFLFAVGWWEQPVFG